MGTRWTRKKTDENGTFTRYRGRLVAKGFSQILGINYFESFSPVASFVTIRTLFALTALPMFKVYQYDVQVAFIQSVIDPTHPPVYCDPAEGYEDRRHYVYQPLRYERFSSRVVQALHISLPQIRILSKQASSSDETSQQRV